MRIGEILFGDLIRDILREELRKGAKFGEDTISINGSRIAMAALAADPGAEAEGWVWYVAGATHKLKFHDGTSVKDVGYGATPGAHDLGGAQHNADTLANLNGKVSDATLIPDTSPTLKTSIILEQTTANYTLSWADPAVARALSIADPLGDDEFVFKAMTQTLANKTLTTPTIGSFTNAAHNHQDAAGGAKLDHGLALNGLADDDHTQYALLAGRAGGQTLVGGTAVSENLTLESTSNVTKGTIIVKDDLVPDVTETGSVGTAGVKFANGYFKNELHIGDLCFNNGFRLKEVKGGIALVNPRGEIVKAWKELHKN